MHNESKKNSERYYSSVDADRLCGYAGIRVKIQLG